MSGKTKPDKYGPPVNFVIEVNGRKAVVPWQTAKALKMIDDGLGPVKCLGFWSPQTGQVDL